MKVKALVCQYIDVEVDDKYQKLADLKNYDYDYAFADVLGSEVSKTIAIPWAWYNEVGVKNGDKFLMSVSTEDTLFELTGASRNIYLPLEIH